MRKKGGLRCHRPVIPTRSREIIWTLCWLKHAIWIKSKRRTGQGNGIYRVYGSQPDGSRRDPQKSLLRLTVINNRKSRFFQAVSASFQAYWKAPAEIRRQGLSYVRFYSLEGIIGHFDTIHQQSPFCVIIRRIRLDRGIYCHSDGKCDSDT